jgi:hypothetical protein
VALVLVVSANKAGGVADLQAHSLFKRSQKEPTHGFIVTLSLYSQLWLLLLLL